MTNLESLSLSVNGLTGPLPSELGRLTALTYLGVHSNSLTGTIPAELGMRTSGHLEHVAAARANEVSLDELTGAAYETFVAMLEKLKN